MFAGNCGSHAGSATFHSFAATAVGMYFAMSAHVAVFLTLNANFAAPVTFLPSLSIPDNVPWSPCKNVTVTWSFPGFGFSGSVGTTIAVPFAVNVLSLVIVSLAGSFTSVSLPLTVSYQEAVWPC